MQGVRSEANVLNDCMIALSKAGAKVFRNNTGALKDRDGRLVRYGLCPGSSDIIGVTKDGLFIAVECKTYKGKPTEKQLRFLECIRSMGGRAGIARCADDAVRILNGEQLDP